ncbi:MAG: hypothetical protein IPG45_23950 [Deltaproteobacteria bacterium]|jgi:hypothetical protein|nr:hypothetical protein [Deltaproteobacteria bacterium]
MSDFDDDTRSDERLRQLGLFHLKNKPKELDAALAKLLTKHQKLEEEGEKERLAIRARLEAEAAAQQAAVAKGASTPSARGPTSQAPAPGTAQAKKNSTLITATKSPGTCTTCRHSNQATRDFDEGHLFCWMDKQPKRHSQPCDVSRALPNAWPMGAPTRWSSYHLYEPFNGENGTYGRSTDLRVMAEDAPEPLRASLNAHLPVLEYDA